MEVYLLLMVGFYGTGWALKEIHSSMTDKILSQGILGVTICNISARPELQICWSNSQIIKYVNYVSIGLS